MSRSIFPINIFQNRRFIPRFHWGGLNDLINGMQQTYPQGVANNNPQRFGIPLAVNQFGVQQPPNYGMQISSNVSPDKTMSLDPRGNEYLYTQQQFDPSSIQDNASLTTNNPFTPGANGQTMAPVTSQQISNQNILGSTKPAAYENIHAEDKDGEDDKNKAKQGKIVVRNAMSLFGSVASPLMGIGATMLNRAMANSNMQANDYYTYQNEMENSRGSINRGGLTSILKYGGKISRFPDGGEMPEDQGPKLIQAEKGETIIDSSGNIFDVKANKLHKDMKRNDVTDILTPDQYVLSNRFELSKKDADKIPIGISPITYDEKKNKGKIKEKYLGELFTKDKHTLAELSKILRDKYPTMFEEQEGNIFAKAASDMNKGTRMNFLQTLVQMNEQKKQKKQQPQDEQMQQMKYGGVPMYDPGGAYLFDNENPLYYIFGAPFSLNQMMALGKQANILANTNKDSAAYAAQQLRLQNEPQKYSIAQDSNPGFRGTGIGLGIQDQEGIKLPPINKPFSFDPKLQSQETKDILQRGAMLQSDPANNNAATPPPPTAKEEESKYMQMVRDQIQRDLDEVEPRYKQGLKGARNLLFQNLTGNAMGTLAGMVGVLSQDAFSEAPKVARVNTPRTMGKGYYDYLNWNNNKALRSTASAALENTGDYGRAMSYIGNALGQTVNANNQMAAQAAQQNLGLESAYQQALSAVRTQQSQFDVGAREQMRSAANSNAANIASLNINKINQDTAINNRYFDYISKLNLDKNLQKQQLYNNLIQMEFIKKYFK